MGLRSADLFGRAQQVLAGGVSRNTLLRAPHPYYAERGVGCRIVDVEGVERIDFSNNMASLIHGHAHPAVVEAAVAQVRKGSAFTMATEVEIEYAQHLCGRSPNFDRIRFMNSGTEAVMAGLKAARAFSGRPSIAKIEGAYHGAYDYAEVSQGPTPQKWGPAERPTSVALAEGTPRSIPDEVVVLPFNNTEAALSVLDAHRSEIACVLLDPMPHRVGMIPIDPDYVRALRDWTQANGSLLMFDEVITFRTEVGGMQERYGVRPDLTALGKIIGGGMPVGALAGRKEVMEVFVIKDGSPARLPQSGTFSANPLTMSMGLAAMRLFDEEAISRLNRLGRLARRRLREAISVADVPASVTGAGSLFRIHLKTEPPDDYRSTYALGSEAQAFKQFIDGLYGAGAVLIHTGAGALSTPMAEAEIDRLAEAVLTSLRNVVAHC